jgi:hypothetical protein
LNDGKEPFNQGNHPLGALFIDGDDFLTAHHEIYLH